MVPYILKYKVTTSLMDCLNNWYFRCFPKLLQLESWFSVFSPTKIAEIKVLEQ